MNGVYRGGQVDSWGQVVYFRSGYRRGARALGFTSSSLGFRVCEWCDKTSVFET